MLIACSDSLQAIKNIAYHTLQGYSDQVDINQMLADGKPLDIAPGNIYIDAPITYTQSKMVLNGAGDIGNDMGGTTVWLANNSNCNALVLGNGQTLINYLRISGIAFEGNKANQTAGKGLVVNLVAALRLIDVSFFDFKEYSGYFDAPEASSGNYHIHAVRCAFNNAGNSGLYSLRTELRLESCYIENNANYGWYQRRGTGAMNYCHNCHFEGNGDYDLFAAGDIEVSGGSIPTIRFDNTNFASLSGAMIGGKTGIDTIWITGGGKVAIIGNPRIGQASSNSSIRLTGATNCIIMGNKLEAGTILEGGSTTENNLIVNNL